MPTFVTGASGFVGSQLAHKLLAAGEQVYALYRSNLDPELESHPNCTPIKGDITQPDTIRDAVESCDKIYHAAAMATNWAKDPSVFSKINVEGSRNVFELAKQAGVKRIVFTSTGAVVGPQHDENPVQETTQRQVRTFLEYERTKIEAEKLAQEYVANGLEIVSVLPTRIYGPGPENKSNVGTFLIRKYLEGNWKYLPGSGLSVGNYVMIRDVVAGHLLAMENGTPGSRYFLGGENATMVRFFELLADASNYHRRLYHVPVPLLLGVGKVIKAYSTVTGTAPLFLAEDIQRYEYNWGVSVEKAERELGYTFTPLPAGLKETVDWLRTRMA